MSGAAGDTPAPAATFGGTNPGPGPVQDGETAPDAAWLNRALGVVSGLGLRARRDEPLAGHTTMRVGGPADLLVVAGDAASLAALVRSARAAGVPLLVLGRGSDVVIADAGVRALVVLARAEGWHIDGDRLTAEAGLPLARAATLAQRAGLSGLEFGLAIPGTVGGAVWANAGAHGADVAGVLESVTILRADGTETNEPAAALELGYRDSRLKRSSADLVLTATFRLSPADPASIRVRLDEIRHWRREHQPLSQPSAGSVFRNPPGDSAGRLIDACGLRGARLGGAAISEKHANFIVNMGGATAADVRRLGDRARQAVGEKFGLDLAYEIQFVGDWSSWRETA
jgi:UDP-N-acetylmuramate dehydrogenase